VESFTSKTSGLGSLTQAHREKKIKQARVCLFIVAGVLVLEGLIGAILLKDQLRTAVDVELKKMGLTRDMVDQAELQKQEKIMVAAGWVIIGGVFVLAALYIVFALLVKSYPVPITVIGLVLYIVFDLALAALNPEKAGQILFGGILIKAIVIFGLIGGIKAAIAYEKEKDLAADMEMDV
jgi:hypothetical protein